MSDLRVAKVLKVIPEANAIDLQYVDGGGKVPAVQVMGDVSSNSGYIDMPEPTPSAGANPLERTNERDVYAIVGTVMGTPIVLGFLAPQVSQLLFKRKNFRVDRHASDLYTTIDDTGAMTIAWPNGTYLKVGEDPENEDLEGLDFDEKWKVARNTDVAPHVKLVVKAGGDQKALVHITPDGDATIQLDGDLNLQVAGTITSSAPDWNHTGDFNLDGNQTVTGDIDADGTITAPDVVGGGKSLPTHTHSGVTAGGATSGPPS